MTISNFVPELWSAAVQVPREDALVFGQPGVVNRDYEGTIRQQGDTVHVTTIADVSVRKYDKTTDLTVDDLSDSDSALLIDQGDYFNFRVNDIDRVQAAGDFQSPATRNAGHNMAAQIDAFLAARMIGSAASGNRLGAKTVAAATPDDAYNLLVDLGVRLAESSIPAAGRFVAVPPKFYGVLQKSKLFTSLADSGSSDTLRNGIVGRAAGFDVLQSNVIPKGGRKVTDAATTSGSKTVTSATAGFTEADLGSSISGTGVPASSTIAAVNSATSVEISANATATGTGVTVTIGTDGAGWVVAGIPDATSLAVQITETEALREQKRFADLVRGLQVYGAKVFEPKALATAAVTVS